MRAKVLETFDGRVEGKRFNAGKCYEFSEDRYAELVRKGYVAKAGDDEAPAKPKRESKAVDSE